MWRPALAAMCGLLCVEAPAENTPATPARYLRVIEQRFTPEKPTVVMNYRVQYRFLSLNLLQVADAVIEATEGSWNTPETGEETPCCVISVSLRSPSAAAGAPRGGRVYINSRIVSVVTMPDLDTLYYLKMTDELLNPVMGTKKDIRNFHVYDMANGGLKFFAHNFLDGTSTTHLTGATDMAAQGREVSRVLTLLSDVYHERSGPIGPDSDFRIFVNCDGTAVPFAARSSRDNVHAFGGKYGALRVDVMPAREAPRNVRTRSFTVWTTSFLDVAERTNDTDLRRIAAEAPAWGMTPLLADYGMAIGQIRCSLSKVSTRSTEAADVTPVQITVPLQELEACSSLVLLQDTDPQIH